jgi:hypothetical protein
MNQSEKRYTLRQLRQAWGAGRYARDKSFEDFLNDELEYLVNQRAEELCATCPCIAQLEERLSDQELTICRLKRAIRLIDQDLQLNDGTRLTEEIRSML